MPVHIDSTGKFDRKDVVRLPKSHYVLVTAARNEEFFIENTLQSVIRQTIRPVKWIIVSDGSTDGTDEIIRRYTKEHDFIRLLKLTRDNNRNFSSQVYAINAGYRLLQGRCAPQYDWIGNLDADISLEPDYFQRIMEKFRLNAKLGLAGGFVYENYDGKFKSRRFNNVRSVPHAVQFFRRECFEAIGGYVPLKYGGPDWCAEVMVRMKGWQAECFPDIRVYHHRHTGSAEGVLHAKFRLGQMDYSLGSHPLFELIKCLSRIREKPYVISAILRMTGYFWLLCAGEKRPVSGEFVKFIQQEQLQRLHSHIRKMAAAPLPHSLRQR
ncbi:MAG: glycosyltransferase family 2 protein [Syntrophales bacterium]